MPKHTMMPAVPEDLPQIREIYNSTVAGRQSTADLEPVSPEERQAWFDGHSGNRPVYVMKNEAGEVVAWGSFSNYHPRAAYRISAEISVYVRHDLRGIGVGKDLLRYMLEKAPSLGIKNVLAVIFGHNHASIRLFESFGFAEWGRLPQVCELDGRRADVVILGKAVKD